MEQYNGKAQGLESMRTRTLQSFLLNKEELKAYDLFPKVWQ